MKSLQSCTTLCDPIDGSPPGSLVPGILQARTLEWVAISSPMCENEVTQLYLTLSDPRDCSPPDSSIHGILQARVLDWGAIAYRILKSRDITLSTKVCLVKAMVFPVDMYGCESWTVKKAEC